LILLVASVVVVGAPSLGGQSEAELVANRERERAAAIQAAKSVASFYAPTLVSVAVDGSIKNIDSESLSQSPESQPTRLDNSFSVHVYRVAALVTGVEYVGIPSVAYRFLRVWRGGEGDAWKIVVSQRTAILRDTANLGSMRGERSVVGPVRANNPPCHTIRTAVDADLRMDKLLTADRDSNLGFMAPEFISIDRDGRVVGRDEFLQALLRSQPVVVKTARGRQFKACDLAVLFSKRETDPGSAARAETELRVMAYIDGDWRQVASQRTPVLQSSR
jgi:hypothetical protein